MSMNNKGLGRGLEALFHGSQLPAELPQNDTNSPYLLVPIDSLVPNPSQPRDTFEETKINELADSIKTQGILQPLIVRPAASEGQYEIIAGERRWRAAKLAGLQLLPVLLRPMDDKEAMVVALVENVQREDLNPIEEARALLTLRDKLGFSQEELGEKIGQSRSTVGNTIRLLKLNPETQEAVLNGTISSGHARALLALPTNELVDELRKQIIEHNLTVRQAEQAVNHWKAVGQFPWQGGNERKKETNPQIMQLAKEIGANFNCNAKINGTSERGRISLAYTSNAQLFDLLDKMGLSLDKIGLSNTD